MTKYLKNCEPAKKSIVVQNCIDHLYGERENTVKDIYLSVVKLRQLDKFFVQEDVEQILSALVRNGFLRRGAFGYFYIPRTLPCDEQ